MDNKISWDELVVGDTLVYRQSDQDWYEIILSVGDKKAKTLNTKNPAKNYFYRTEFSAIADGLYPIAFPEQPMGRITEKDYVTDFRVIRDDLDFSPVASKEDVEEFYAARAKEKAQKEENARNLLSNLERLKTIQDRVMALSEDDNAPFEQLYEEHTLFHKCGRAGEAVLCQWMPLYKARFIPSLLAKMSEHK